MTDLVNFLYNLRYNYVNNFDKIDSEIFENFYDSYPKEVIDNHSFLIVIGDILNNLPYEICYILSKIQLIFASNDKYLEESGGYWASVYDNDNGYIALNKDIYNTLSKDYYTQEQYHRVLLHEYAHYMIYKEIISENIIFELLDTNEKVSKQASMGYIENAADSFALFLMSLGIYGDSENNPDIVEFKSEFPKTYQIWTNWLENISQMFD